MVFGDEAKVQELVKTPTNTISIQGRLHNPNENKTLRKHITVVILVPESNNLLTPIQLEELHNDSKHQKLVGAPECLVLLPMCMENLQKHEEHDTLTA